MPLTVDDCILTTNSIEIVFSHDVTTNSRIASQNQATNLPNYAVYDQNSAYFSQPIQLSTTIPSGLSPQAIVGPANVVKITFRPLSPSPSAFKPGDWVVVVIKHVHGINRAIGEIEVIDGDVITLTRQVPGGAPGGIRRDVDDLVAYPILTEQVSHAPSPISRTGGGVLGLGFGGGASLGQTAADAVGDILGWKVNPSDPKGFIGALTQSFSLVEVEGHVESKWNARTHPVVTDLAGGITGAQASLYARAKDGLDQCLPLLDGLYPLDPNADPEYVNALREMAKSQMTEIIKEIGTLGPPSILRVNTYFRILLGQEKIDIQRRRPQDLKTLEGSLVNSISSGMISRHDSKAALDALRSEIVTDPDQIRGTLGAIREVYGIWFVSHDGRKNVFSNSIEDEEDITNFRVISDYMTSLLQTWIENARFFVLGLSDIPAFLGTQLVLISRQFSVIAETVNEVRFALNSVFIGPAERQTLLIQFTPGSGMPPMYLEDILVEVEKLMTDEGPRLLKSGGRIAINNNVLPVVQTLQDMIEEAHHPANVDELPDGYRTVRVRKTLDDLRDQLTALSMLANQVGMDIPSRRVIG